MRGAGKHRVWGCAHCWELGDRTLDVQHGRGLAVTCIAGVAATVGQLAAAQLQDAAPSR